MQRAEEWRVSARRAAESKLEPKCAVPREERKREEASAGEKTCGGVSQFAREAVAAISVMGPEVETRPVLAPEALTFAEAPAC
jgi:hypothetical protein